MAPNITKILKRNGDVVAFESDKIADAIFKAAASVGGHDRTESERLTDLVIARVNTKFHARSIPAVEEVQDIVEQILIEEGHVATSKAYIIYREKQREKREQREDILGKGEAESLDFSLNALQVLEKRYLLKDEKGKTIESPQQLLRRVARSIAKIDKKYGGNVKESEEKFYNMMAKLEFLPNSPTLMNAGTDIGQLSACFVLPVADSIGGIFDSLKHTALIHKSGGGTGFSFSRLRPSNDMVASTTGVSSGPISFMKIFDAATEQIKQGGKRRGANMGILRVDHPNIIDFITAKSDLSTLTNFNVSVAITDKFMKALEKGGDYELYNPRDGSVAGRLPASEVFERVVANAWQSGEPGIVFIDEINRKSPVGHIAPIEATNPCGEQPLLPYESCNLGSINLNKFLTADDTALDWDKFRETVRTCTHFLDNVIDANNYPIKEIADMTRSTRKIGLGVMGFADVLYRLGIPYNSAEGLKMAEKLMKNLTKFAQERSMELAKERGTFPAWKGSTWQKKGIKIRNACLTTQAPTGTIGMLAEASGGIEPNFAISFIKNVMDGTELVYVNEHFEKMAKEEGFHSKELMREIAQVGSVQGFKEIPKKIRDVFVTSQDISPESHIHMQAAFQKHVDAAISKTINFPASATMEEVEQGYLLAYKLKCKGVTVYRDGSRDGQVLNIGKVNKKGDTAKPAIKQVTETPCADQPGAKKKPKSKAEIKKEGKCPECGSKSVDLGEGCITCHACGYSACSV